MASVKATIELIDKMSSTLSTIESNVNSMKKAIEEVGGKQSDIDKFSWNGFLQKAENAAEKMESIGKKMSLAITAPLIALGKKTYGTATDYESAFAGVKKTTDATEDEYNQLYEGLLHIAETNPTGFVEAAGIMEMAGQLGVAKDQLLGFTEAYIGLQESTNISGEDGAADLARFLNVTEKTTENVGKVGGVIVALGNNFATTENEILQMATRMGATADLAGFSSAEILAFSAALSSVGINAEAGGSAAGKLMKKMQLAAEVGGSVQEKLYATNGWEFDSGLEFVNYLESLSKADLIGMANQMGVTTDALKEMGDSWLALDQFASVMGVSKEGFLKGWNESAAGSMLKFFQGLGNLDPESGNSVLAQLAEMDITEIRLSNLVAAMAGNSDLFQQALALAYAQYGTEEEANAMAEEVAKRYETQESQNEMLGNKLENTLADFGQNLVTLLQPALDMVNNILEAFNSLSEVDQTNILKGLGVIAVLGPGLSIAGKAIELISKSMQLISSHGKGAADAVKGVVDAAGANGAAGAAQTAGNLTIGDTFSGVGGLAAIIAGFNWAANERKTNEEIRGSENAVENAAEGVTELQNAFVDYVNANAALNDYINSSSYSDEGVIPFLDDLEAKQNLFQSMEGWEGLMDAYSAWRQENSLSNMDWILPENLFGDAGLSSAGADVVNGLAEGISENTAAVEAATEAGTNTIEAANAALGVNSPSIYMLEAGMNMDIGLQMGIQAGQVLVVTAMSTLGNQVVSVVRSILSTAAGNGIGLNFAIGLANGIRAGKSTVITAATEVATSALESVSNILGIHSPSTETYWQGEMMVQGYTNALYDGASSVKRAVGKVIGDSETQWNNGVWDIISGFAGIESQALQDKMNDIEDGMTISDSDVSLIRQLAEREAINHFTTAEVRVEMNNNNTISSDMDIDGIITQLEDRVAERLEAVAEGVYM